MNIQSNSRMNSCGFFWKYIDIDKFPGKYQQNKLAIDNNYEYSKNTINLFVFTQKVNIAFYHKIAYCLGKQFFDWF
jgi:hypothetical protein